MAKSFDPAALREVHSTIVDIHDVIDGHRELLSSLDPDTMTADDIRHMLRLMERSLQTTQKIGTRMRLVCEDWLELLDAVPPADGTT